MVGIGVESRWVLVLGEWERFYLPGYTGSRAGSWRRTKARAGLALLRPRLYPTPRWTLPRTPVPAPAFREAGGVIHNPSRLRRAVWKVAEVVMTGVVRGLFRLARAVGPDRSSDIGGAIARRLGPLLPAHRTGLKNLKAAFPEKSESEIRAILRGAWDNLGRTGAEYAHLGVLFDYDHESGTIDRVEVEGVEHFIALLQDGKPGLVFSAHLANWELPAICAARYGLEATAVFRPPNDPAVAHLLHEIRSQTMGGLEAARQGAAFAMRGVLERGGHLGMLIDQHFTRGVPVEFFGRPALANPVMAKFARAFDCPVHGVRVIRLPGNRFKLELTPPLDLPRDAEGLIDVQGAMQAMTRIVEGWAREHPEQWLWMHRRWRPPISHGRLKAT